jgi:hypothetical protein
MSPEIARGGLPVTAAVDLLLLLFVLVVPVLFYTWHFRRAASLLAGWAQQNGYRIISQQYRWIFWGPFSWTLSNLPAVYRVTVEDREHNRRSGWVRCGNWFSGLLSSSAEARWDEAERRSPHGETSARQR